MDENMMELVKKATRCDALIECLFASASLNYSKDDLYINGSDVGVLLRCFEPERYAATLAEMQDREKAKEAAKSDAN